MSYLGKLNEPHSNAENPLAQIYCSSQGARAVRYLMTALLVLSVVLSAVTTAIVVANPSFGEPVGVLSLRSTPPPSDEPLFMVESAANARYLRGAIGTSYDGKAWQLKLIQGKLDVEYNTEDLPLRPAEIGLSYREYERDVLNAASPLDVAEDTRLPSCISDRTIDLSLGITEAFDTTFEKARAIEVYLKLNYTYALDFEPAPPGWEPNDWFLFQSRKGICGNFASAFVVLARASGIPSRLAAGYFVRSGQGQQVIYADQAHAWAEVGFQGLGWLAFDAT